MIGLTFIMSFPQFSLSLQPSTGRCTSAKRRVPTSCSGADGERAEESTERNAEHITFQLPVVVAVHSEPDDSVSIQPSTPYDKLETINP